METGVNHPSEFAALFKLPLDQRIQLAEALWESVADETPALPVPQWQLEELRRRASRFEAGTAKTLTWEAVKWKMSGEAADGQ